MKLRASKHTKGNKSNANTAKEEPGDVPQETMAGVPQDCENITEIIQDALQKEDSKNKKENGYWKGKLK